MKVLFLNAWGGKVGAPLSEFIKHHTHDTDVFCFQESDRSMPALCTELLASYRKIPAHKFVSDKDNFHQTIYVRKTIPILSSGIVLHDQDNVGLGLYVQIKQSSDCLYICNFHGLSRPVDKHDTPDRLRQAQGLIDFFATKPGAKVIGGDFNVFPTNPSLQLFRQKGYQDLIHDYNITNTRNRLVWDRYPENDRQYYSDYVFVSNDLLINSFTVPNIEVSDHLPLILNFSPQVSLSAANLESTGVPV